jgi:hypothetical protein
MKTPSFRIIDFGRGKFENASDQQRIFATRAREDVIGLSVDIKYGSWREKTRMIPTTWPTERESQNNSKNPSWWRY